MSAVISNEAELHFERGGPSYLLMQRLGLIREGTPSVLRRCIAFLALTWIPMLVLSLWDGHALGATPRQSFLLDFAAYARFFIAVPILFVAEKIVGPRLMGAGLHFIRAGLVLPDEYPAFEAAIARAARRRESWIAEAVILALALVGAWTVTTETLTGAGGVAWSSLTIDGQASLAGYWNQFIAVPIIQFLWFRWIWRLVIWTLFLRTVSKLKLALVPTHADQAGGLGFLGNAHASLGIFAFGMSAVLSASAAFRIVFEDAKIDTFKTPFVIVLVVAEVLFLAPLFWFSPVLARMRRQWLQSYGMLVLTYNRAFHEKWIEATEPPGEPLLGSADIQSLADLGNSFEFIRSMKLFPFNRMLLLQLAVATALPGLPLILLVFPIGQILDILGGAVL